MNSVIAGYGGGLTDNVTFVKLRQDAFSFPSLIGGRGCDKYAENYRTHGGFGGGGGPCKAGGGGGGYTGRSMSQLRGLIQKLSSYKISLILKNASCYIITGWLKCHKKHL